MLSSDLIAFYNEQVDGMIEPWSDELLKPAAYELTLGAYYVIDGKVQEPLTELRPWLELPKNSIVFVSTEQRIRLPHYIAARFDLAIEFIYQGILLGTGPQVDPGFQGYLSCPLHNISSDSVHMQFGKPFAKMDFAKTSGLRETDTSNIEDQAALDARATELKGKDEKPVKLFNAKKRWRPPIIDPGYAGSKDVGSSVKDIQKMVESNRRDVGEFGNEIRSLRRFGLASGLVIFLAIVALLITLAQLDRSYTDAKVGSIVGQTSPAAVKSLRVRLGRDEALLCELKARLAKPAPNAKKKRAGC